MANYICYCKSCGTGLIAKKNYCFACQEKLNIIRKSGVFGAKERYTTTWERPSHLGAYTHKMGSETQRLVDFVNESGTIHYGRYVAKKGMCNND